MKLKPEAIRTNLKMNQPAFAKKIGMNVNTYRRKLKNQAWKYTEVLKMCEAGGITIDQFQP